MAFDSVCFQENVSQTIKDNCLIRKGDKVIVACSGGKDSTALLYLLNEFGYIPEALIIDLSKGEYFDRNLRNLRGFCKEQGIRLHESDVSLQFGHSMCYMSSVMARKCGAKSCAVCGTLKRYMLNKKAREIGASKIAFGHNLDDEAQSILMNIMNGNTGMGLSLGPRNGSRGSGAFVERIKPLCFTEEKHIAEYSKSMGFPVVYEKCPCSVDAFRRMLRVKLNEMEELHPGTKMEILSGYLRQAPRLRNLNSKRLVQCSSCGEPSSNLKCSACLLLESVRAA
jgi:uncharacterized protein (TIGR00269 family)